MSKTQWITKYRATSLDELILSDRVRNLLQRNTLQNLLIYGSFGIGKSSFANILIKFLGKNAVTAKSRKMADIIDIYKINHRTSVVGGNFVALIDEAEALQVDTQKALLRYLEGENTAIEATVFIVNDIKGISRGIKSRCKEIDFNWRDNEKEQLLGAVYARMEWILEQENVKYSSDTLCRYVSKHCVDGDIRKVVSELQGSISENRELLDV